MINQENDYMPIDSGRHSEEAIEYRSSGKEPYVFRADKPGDLLGAVPASYPRRCLSHDFPRHTV